MGELRRKDAQGGFILLDLLIGIFLISGAIISVFAGVSAAVRTTREVEKRALILVEERTLYAAERQTAFRAEE